MSHVGVQFVVAKVAIAAELAERMDATLDLILRYALLLSALRRGKVGDVLGERVQRVFVREDLLVGDAQVASFVDSDYR
jgi:hypothetical protein